MQSASDTACPGCGRAIDPLRAGHVCILEGRFQYFCGASCKQHYMEVRGRPSEEDVETAQPPIVANGRGATPTPAPDAAVSQPAISRTRPPAAPVTATAARALSVSATPPASRRSKGVLAAIDAVGIVSGVLVAAIELLGEVADLARIPLALTAWTAVMARIARTEHDPADPHPLVTLAPTTGAVVATCWARAAHDPHAIAVAVFAGLACATAIAIERLVARGRLRVNVERGNIERALNVRVRAVRGAHTAEFSASEIRPGEQIVVETGEVVGVDATVVAGEAALVPWLGAGIEVTRKEGDPVVAGARVTSSRLRMTTTWSGHERAWVKLLSVPENRIDVAAPTARAVRLTVERGAVVAALLGGVAAFAANSTAALVLASMSATAIAFVARGAASFVGLQFARAHLEALARGITYKDSRAFERAGGAQTAVLNARGTVLLGEPELVAVEAIDSSQIKKNRIGEEVPAGMDSDSVRILALAAGAETGSTHPFAAAILRAARMRGIRPDPVRNATVWPGQGVTAIASTGERVVVGRRSIMLEQKIGGAVLDARVNQLEAQGRSVLLVALGDRVVGLIALQDGLRAGARAAVQILLDASIEPVLLSGEARDTCETIGRALDIEHVRPEVLPADRGAEVRALAEGGNVVSVIGHPASDDAALAAADVAVAMGAAGGTPGEWAVALASDDVRDAARALAIPHAARARVGWTIALGVGPGLMAMLAIAFGVAPLACAPMAALLAVVTTALHAREMLPAPPNFGSS
jgi:P-type Cu+ transporter